ncbi:unnamed protein product [Brassica napus]|uniref:(rape) hypothetical protein n=1 Tax=Brassica napus TaxID=3708 RepID=A0A816MUZ1_BRANA|nr:unnamed protein product [Brassica napus]
MLLATLGWLMVILSIHVQYYALQFFISVKVVLVVFIKPSLTIQLQLAEILIMFHLLSLLRDSNDKVNRYIMLRAAQGLAYLHELQALVLLKKGIGDNTHFVTARVPEETTMHLRST